MGVHRGRRRIINGGAWLIDDGMFNQLAQMAPVQVKPVMAAKRGAVRAPKPGKSC